MKPSHARFLVRLYPRAWRKRYRNEFQAFLESRHVSALETLNIAACALLERARESWPLIGIACAITLASAFSFYLGVSDQPHLVLWLCWAAIVAAAAAQVAPLIRSSRKSTQAVLRGPRIWLYFFGAVILIETIFALFRVSPWSAVPAPALMWLGGRKLVPRITASMTTPQTVFVLIASVMTSSTGAGLLVRSQGAFGHYLLVIVALLATASGIIDARKLLIKRGAAV